MTSADQTLLENQPPSACGRFAAVAVIVLATLLGGGVRFFQLGDGGAWIDELYTVRDVSSENASSSPTRWLGYQPTKLAMWARGISPGDVPGDRYEAFQSAGITMHKARFAACLIGLLTIPLLAWAAWRPLGPGAAAMLAVLIALCIWHVSWSQTARFYTQVGLFGGLGVLLYIDAITSGSRWRFAGATVCVVLAYLSHPPALAIGGAFALDGIIQLIRRKPLNYGWWGWSWGIGSIAVCLGVMAFESLNKQRGYGGFVGGEAEIAQNPAMIIVYLVVMLTPALALASLAGLILGRRSRAVWVLAFAGAIPLIAMVGVAATGGFAHTRYSFVGFAGWLGLAAVGLTICAQTLRPKLGPIMSWAPAGFVLAGLVTLLGSYLTTGHRLREPFHLAWATVVERIEPDDVVFAERTEVARFYLERADVLPMPGVIEAIDEKADGHRAWLVRLSGNSRGGRAWKPGLDPRVELIRTDAGAVWLPRREISTYLFTPSPTAPEPPVMLGVPQADGAQP